jgi:glycosyltransferase involved in cell wall biosynthesis
MRTLMISKALVVGAYHRKISEMASLGIKIDLLIPTTWGKQKPEIIQAANYKIHQLPISFSGKNHFHFYHGLSALIDSVSPDILHIDEEPYSLVTFEAMRIAKKKNIDTLFFTWQNIFKNYPFPFSSIEQYSYDVAKCAIAGNLEAKEIMQRKGFSKEIFGIPQFGVDPNLFFKHDGLTLKEKLFGSGKVHVIGYIGRLVEEKGILTLLKAFAALPNDSRLLVIGDGPMKNNIQEIISGLLMNERVVLVDSIASKNVPLYLNCLDCLVLPSLTRSNWKEQFGRIIIEAMACEVPVIGSDSGEIPSVVGDAGMIFREGDVSDLREKMDKLLRDSSLINELQNRGRVRVLEKYTQKHIAEQTLEVYEHMLQMRKK